MQYSLLILIVAISTSVASPTTINYRNAALFVRSDVCSEGPTAICCLNSAEYDTNVDQTRNGDCIQISNAVECPEEEEKGTVYCCLYWEAGIGYVCWRPGVISPALTPTPGTIGAGQRPNNRRPATRPNRGNQRPVAGTTPGTIASGENSDGSSQDNPGLNPQTLTSIGAAGAAGAMNAAKNFGGEAVDVLGNVIGTGLELGANALKILTGGSIYGSQ